MAVLIALLLSLYLPMGDLGERIADLQSGSSTTVRLSMWQVAYHAGWDAPWFGHGLGSFQAVFHQTFFEMVQNGTPLTYVNFLNHPHNETLLWWVETGVLGVVVIFGSWLVAFVILGLWRNPNAAPFVLAGLPIALHSQTEFPLHASGAHWWLAGFIAVSFANPKQWRTYPIQVRPAWPVLCGVIGFFVSLLLVHAAVVSYKAWDNGRYRFNTVDAYIQGRQDHVELRHWAMGQQSRDFWVLSMARLSVTDRNADLSRQLLPRLLDMQTRWQGPIVWDAVANLYAVLGQPAELRQHIEWVAAFQPDYAVQIEDRLAVHLQAPLQDRSQDRSQDQ